MTINNLNVYLNKNFIGVLKQDVKGGGSLSFSYDTQYVNSQNPLPLSISLPIKSEIFNDKSVRPFFAGLLPENEQLDLLSKQLKTSAKNPFAILAKIGRDCAGSVEVLGISEKPIKYGEGKTIKLTEDKLYNILNEVYSNPLLAGGKKKIKLSLAGAQSKIAVFFDEKANSLPELTDGLPSTHILKPTMPHFPDSVYNEFFCMKLAQKMGLNVAEVFLKFAKEKPFLLIRRYDRKQVNGLTTRIHQEDFCQALGIMPEMKYQGIDGGPGIRKCMDLITKNSSQPANDILHFIHAIIFNYLIGNADAHGKNFSFLFQDDKTTLAPLYDLLCTATHKQLDQNMAMKIGRIKNPERMTLHNWHSLVPNTQTAKLTMTKMLRMSAHNIKCLAEELQNDFDKQDITSPIFDDIIKVISNRSSRIMSCLQ